ncbi:MAG TPA: hypothetical protein VFS44_06545 [Gemmatimonadaceae bacterium]|nr:hypothetical protein [Gemmatimonadaceae bacterium]
MRIRELWPARALARRAPWLAAVAMVVCSTGASAQTRFVLADTTVDVGKYTTVEECAAAVLRVKHGMERHERKVVWKDTLPFDPHDLMAPLPEATIATARRCTARYAAATVPVTDFAILFPLYLIADRDADAATLAKRRLAAISTARGTKPASPPAAAAKEERTAVLDSVFTFYMDAQPARVSPAESLVVAFDRSVPRPLQAGDVHELLKMYGMLGNQAAKIMDSTTLKARGARAVALVDSLSPGELEVLKDKFGEDGAGWKATFLGMHMMQAGLGVMLDSLRRSTAAFAAYMGGLWTESTGERPEASEYPIGKTAPRLVGNLLSGKDSAAGPPRPVPGKVNLVVFVDGMCTDVVPLPPPYHLVTNVQHCYEDMSELRRLAARFPALEITLVDRTRGSYMYLHPQSAAEEASLIAKSLEAHRVPGTPVISASAFLRVAAPDRRLIPKTEQPNFTAYQFGKIFVPGGGQSLLVDQDGVIVFSGIGTSAESDWISSQMIGILLARQTASAGADRSAPASPR